MRPEVPDLYSGSGIIKLPWDIGNTSLGILELPWDNGEDKIHLPMDVNLPSEKQGIRTGGILQPRDKGQGRDAVLT